MWLYRGAQSAVFYYASCTPCAAAADQNKRKKEAIRSQREKEKSSALVTDQPRPVPQPTAFSTNPGWKEEIALGPGPPARRHRPNNNRTGGPRPSVTSPSLSAESLEDESPQKKEKGGLGERWNWMRYQREDEPLWGDELRGSSVGISGSGKTNTGNSSKYYVARAPPVNDLHPPIVSGPTSRAETRWMLQPPPSARVMAGKERFDPSSSRGSQGTRRNGSSRKRNPNLKAPSSKKEEKAEDVQRGQSIPQDERPSRPHNDGSPAASRKKPEKKHKPPPITISNNPNLGDLNVPTRPPLATIASYSVLVSDPNHPHDEFYMNASSRSYSPSTPSSVADSSEASPGLFRCPETPRSRPGSDDSGKAFRTTPISKTLTTLQPYCKDVQSFHVEINDERDGMHGPDQLRKVRPWRWSMDI